MQGQGRLKCGSQAINTIFRKKMYMLKNWEGKKALNMFCIPEDATHPYGTEKIPVEIVNIEVYEPKLVEVQDWEKWLCISENQR